MFKKKKKLNVKVASGIGLLIVVLLLSFSGYAQTKKITGKVTSGDDKQVMPGVFVKVKGTNNTSPTDVNGNYSIEAKENAILVFTFLGYQTKEVVVKKETTIDITLEILNKNLNEVVVIGYGTASRGDLTGSISSLKANEIKQSVSATLDQAMQGRMAGVVVNANSGQPGGGVSVQIRGIGSLRNADPLYVVDGVFFDGGDSNRQIYTGGDPGTNPLSTINPSDIESIDVLKDASATAIYGSRGSNGVVLITTKKGKTGAPKISFDGYYGIQQLPKRVAVLDLQQFASYRNAQAAINFGTPNPAFQDPSILGPGTNWQEALFRNAPMKTYNFSVGGGDNRTTFFVSAGYYDQQGIAIKSGFNRYTGRINLDNKTTNWLKIGTNIQLTQTNEQINNQDGGLIQLAIRQSPDIAVTNPDGSYGGPTDPQFTLTNPFGLTEINTNERSRSQFYGSAYADITFLKDFVLRNEIAGNYEFGKITQFNPSYQFGLYPNLTSFSRRSNNTYYNNTIRTYLTYNHTFGKVFRLNGTLGHEANLSESASVDATGAGFTSNISSELSLADATKATSTSNRSQNSMESYYARFNTTLYEKYVLTSTVRYDGSSRFSPTNRWNFSYAFGLAYKLSEESFIKKYNFISDLKVRLGYGILPNQGYDNYIYGASFRGLQTGLGNNLLLTNLPNPDAKWENTKNSNIGIDAGFFKNRINITIDAYYKNTDGLLTSLAEPLYSGTTSGFSVAQLSPPVVNIGSITNKGYEFSINTDNIRSKNFSWSSTITYSANKNKVTSLINDATIIPQYIGTDIVQQVSVGLPIGEFFGYQAEGVYKNAAELNSHARPVNNTTGLPLPIGINSVWVGDVKFKDVNNDGIIDSRDIVDLGSSIPKFQFGINNVFKYKGFDLTVFFNGNYGNKIFNQLKQVNENTNSNNAFGLLASVNNYARIGKVDPAGSSTDVNNLVVTNPDTNVPRISASDVNLNNRVSSRYIEDGSYIRLKNLVFGYNLPGTFIKRFKITNFRIYTNIANVFTITNYTGYDPEVGSRFQNAQSAGVDYGRYPSQRIYTFGVNIGL
jgi:TonB-linked SusC/RagA family outer membrane protein